MSSSVRWWDDPSTYQLVLIGLLEWWRCLLCRHDSDGDYPPQPCTVECYWCQHGTNDFSGYFQGLEGREF